MPGKRIDQRDSAGAPARDRRAAPAATIRARRHRRLRASGRRARRSRRCRRSTRSVRAPAPVGCVPSRPVATTRNSRAMSCAVGESGVRGGRRRTRRRGRRARRRNTSFECPVVMRERDRRSRREPLLVHPRGDEPSSTRRSGTAAVCRRRVCHSSERGANSSAQVRTMGVLQKSGRETDRQEGENHRVARACASGVVPRHRRLRSRPGLIVVRRCRRCRQRRCRRVVVGAVVLIVSMLTKYPLGVVKVLPFTVHSAGDYLAAALLIVAVRTELQQHRHRPHGVLHRRRHRRARCEPDHELPVQRQARVEPVASSHRVVQTQHREPRTLAGDSRVARSGSRRTTAPCDEPANGRPGLRRVSPGRASLYRVM